MMKTRFLRFTLAFVIIPSVAMGFRFPEMPFCPAGGPPGWFNSMTGQNDRYYGPPPAMFRPVYPTTAPYNGWQSPLLQQPPLYYPFNPGG